MLYLSQNISLRGDAISAKFVFGALEHDVHWGRMDQVITATELTAIFMAENMMLVGGQIDCIGLAGIQ